MFEQKKKATTEARIYSSRVRRELNRIEAITASALYPGSKLWRLAGEQLAYATLGDQDKVSPTKRVAILNSALRRMTRVPLKDSNICIVANLMAKRTGHIHALGAFWDDHPIENIREQGIVVQLHLFDLARSSVHTSCLTGVETAYISEHALRRWYDRSTIKPTEEQAVVLSLFAGYLGMMTKGCEKHEKGEFNVLLDGTIMTGSLKHSRKMTTDGKRLDGTYLDVRTVLPYDDVVERARWDEAARLRLTQAEIVTRVIATGMDERSYDFERMAEAIPYIPRRADFITRAADTH